MERNRHNVNAAQIVVGAGIYEKGIFALRWYSKRAILTVRYEGFHILLWRILKMCLLPLGYLGYAIFYRKDLTQPINEISTSVGLTVTQATETDIDELVNLVVQRYGPTKNLEWYAKLGIRETILQRLQRGCKCFVGKVGTQIVHYNWIFPQWEESVPGTGRFIHLREDEALMNDGFTAEGWRGKSIHGAVHSQMLIFLKRAGHPRAFTIAGSVKSARKPLDRIGWDLTGVMLFFIPRGRQKAWICRVKGTLTPFVNEEIPM